MFNYSLTLINNFCLIRLEIILQDFTLALYQIISYFDGTKVQLFSEICKLFVLIKVNGNVKKSFVYKGLQGK